MADLVAEASSRTGGAGDLAVPSAAAPAPRRIAELVLHLTLRNLQSQHRFTFLGWVWPLVRQLAQLLVLVFLFSQVFDTGIDDFPVFVFSGLLLWSWFSTGVTAATTSVLDQRHLLLTPGFPPVVLPLVAMTVPLIDALMAFPVLLAMLLVAGHLNATIVLLPLVLAVLYAFTAGVSLVVAALNVYYRDVRSVVGVSLMVLFYVTPIFYGIRNVPTDLQWLLHLNPLTAIVDSARDLLIAGALPGPRDLAISVGAAVALFVAGWWTFHRLAPDFADEL